MISLKKISFIGLYATLSLVAIGQTVCPTAPNFMNLHSPCVVATYGKYTGGGATGWTNTPFINTGVVDGRHTLITTQGFDPNTGNRLPLIPEGQTQSVRLGNQQIGAEAEAITYHFEVQANAPLLAVNFAVVLEDAGHNFDFQPRFIVRILDDNDQLINFCAEYDITATAGITGFETYSGRGTPIRWRDWSTIAVDLSPYIGQAVKVQFVTYDCGHSGHFGYAYFTAECLSNELELTACTNDTIYLNAPPYAEYLWSNGDTTASTFYIMGENPIFASALIQSFTGCEITLNAYIASDLPNKDTTIFDTICQDEPYTKHHYDLPPQYSVGTSTHINMLFDAEACAKTAKTFLYLTVRQRFYPLYDVICQGENYTRNGFNIVQPPSGTVRDTLILPRENNCDSLVCLVLTVSPASQSFPTTIVGNTSPCSGELETYSMPNAEFFTSFRWFVPENANIIRGYNTATIALQFTHDAPADTLKLHVANGCGDRLLALFIEPKESHYVTFIDSICSGSDYSKNDFNIPRQDSAGYFVFIQRFSTQDGCDSVHTLHLYVFPTPEVEILSSADVLCEGDSVELQAISLMQTVDFVNVKIGDILCTDETVETPENFPTSGKTAQGVIFWINPDRTLCWVIDIRFSSPQPQAPWGNPAPIPNVPEITSAFLTSGVGWIFNDTAGYRNTLAMRNGVDTTTSWGRGSAAWRVDFDNGWFLPAYTQAVILVANLPLIYQSFAFAGGVPPFLSQPLPAGTLNELWRLWISAQGSGSMAIVIDSSGTFLPVNKPSLQFFRSMRYFKLTP